MNPFISSIVGYKVGDVKRELATKSVIQTCRINPVSVTAKAPTVLSLSLSAACFASSYTSIYRVPTIIKPIFRQVPVMSYVITIGKAIYLLNRLSVISTIERNRLFFAGDKRAAKYELKQSDA